MDDDIVDAELVEEGDLFPEIVTFSLPAEFFGQGPVEQALPTSSLDGAIRLNAAQAQLLRMALAHYYDKGPRQRNTRAILDLMDHLSEFEDSLCTLCAGSGRVRNMYEVQYCGCRAGLRARQDGVDNGEVYRNVR